MVTELNEREELAAWLARSHELGQAIVSLAIEPVLLASKYRRLKDVFHSLGDAYVKIVRPKSRLWGNPELGIDMKATLILDIGVRYLAMDSLIEPKRSRMVPERYRCHIYWDGSDRFLCHEGNWWKIDLDATPEKVAEVASSVRETLVKVCLPWLNERESLSVARADFERDESYWFAAVASRALNDFAGAERHLRTFVSRTGDSNRVRGWGKAHGITIE